MELVLNNNFMEMNEQEMMDVDGGFVFTLVGIAMGLKIVGGIVTKSILGSTIMKGLVGVGVALDVAVIGLATSVLGHRIE